MVHCEGAISAKPRVTPTRYKIYHVNLFGRFEEKQSVKLEDTLKWEEIKTYNLDCCKDNNSQGIGIKKTGFKFDHPVQIFSFVRNVWNEHSGKYKKTTVNVELPNMLTTDGNTRYLTSFICHVGNHFIAYVCVDSNWYKADDDKIEECNINSKRKKLYHEKKAIQRNIVLAIYDVKENKNMPVNGICNRRPKSEEYICYLNSILQSCMHTPSLRKCMNPKGVE